MWFKSIACLHVATSYSSLVYAITFICYGRAVCSKDTWYTSVCTWTYLSRGVSSCPCSQHMPDKVRSRWTRDYVSWKVPRYGKYALQGHLIFVAQKYLVTSRLEKWCWNDFDAYGFRLNIYKTCGNSYIGSWCANWTTDRKSVQSKRSIRKSKSWPNFKKRWGIQYHT